MDHSLPSLDRHFKLPHIRQVDAARPIHWLRLGWGDLRENAFASIAYGIVLAVVGYLILAFAATRPYLTTASISGFFLVGPLAAAGLYEISRRAAANQPSDLMSSVRGVRDKYEPLLMIGLVLAVTMISWERMSALLFALLVPAEIHELDAIFSTLFLSGQHLGFVAAYMVAGGLIAASIFIMTVVAVPMLMDRDTDTITAMMASVRAASLNRGAMLLWAALIVVLTGIGFATMMIGLVILFPLLGHATWHAYRDLVE